MNVSRAVYHASLTVAYHVRVGRAEHASFGKDAAPSYRDGRMVEGRQFASLSQPGAVANGDAPLLFLKVEMHILQLHARTEVQHVPRPLKAHAAILQHHMLVEDYLVVGRTVNGLHAQPPAAAFAHKANIPLP